MTFSLQSSATSFSSSVEELLAKVECRPADQSVDQDQIFRLRYQAYSREGALPPNAPLRFKDRFDDAPNTKTFGFYIDGVLASSLRLHIVDTSTPDHPGLHVFQDYLRPAIDRGEIIVDPTRFVVDAESSRQHPKLPYVTVRLAFLASAWFSADRLLATVRSEHQAFYKRLFGHRVVCDARPYPTLTKPLSLMVLDYPAEHDRVVRRYPFFQSSRAERERLFGAWDVGAAEVDDTLAMVA